MSIETRTIDLVPLHAIEPPLLTSYATKRRGTRDSNNRPFPEGELLAVPKGDAWRATPKHADALIAIDREWVKRKKRRARLTEVLRPYATVVEARTKYETWIAAGKPTKPPAFDARTMKAAFVLPPNQTNHQWGGAVDFDIEAMCDDDDDLAELWDVADDHGLRPVISQPNLGQSESWHFDRRGPLVAVDAVLRQHGHKATAYAWTAMVGCILAGQFVGNNPMARMAQARLMLAGAYVGAPDGDIGPTTIAGARALGLELPASRVTSDHILVELDKKNLAVAVFGEF